MTKRFLTIWFRYLKTDWFNLRQTNLKQSAFVLAVPSHGRMVISTANALAEEQGIYANMVVADARAIFPSLIVLDDKPELANKLLRGFAEWFIRYTPVVSIDHPDGLILDITGCAHLWGGEKTYLENIINRLKKLGYTARGAIADTIGTAWAVTHFGKGNPIVENGEQIHSLYSLPPEALRIEAGITESLHKLGLKKVGNFINMPKPVLRRRFGNEIIQRLNQALGVEEEFIQPVTPVEPYNERLKSLELITTLTGIEIALQRLLDALCKRLQQEQKGLRSASFICYRIDNKIQKIEIGTNRATFNAKHLFKLFETRLGTIEPGLGIELFVLEAKKIEDVVSAQEKLWQGAGGLDNNVAVAELIDRLEGKFGAHHIQRYLPDEHYWPERSMKPASGFDEKPTTQWNVDRPRPIQLLEKPEPITVTAPVPDYPPMLFRYKGKLHKISKADGPERIEQEWWLQQGQHRDYYYVEDEEGCRYWIFRSGYYTDKSFQWFIHGFFA